MPELTSVLKDAVRQVVFKLADGRVLQPREYRNACALYSRGQPFDGERGVLSCTRFELDSAVREALSKALQHRFETAGIVVRHGVWCHLQATLGRSRDTPTSLEEIGEALIRASVYLGVERVVQLFNLWVKHNTADTNKCWIVDEGSIC